MIKRMLVILAIVATLNGFTKIAPDEFVVTPGSFRYFAFTIRNSTRRVMGEFRASGGTRNDIYVYIVAQEEMENFANGNGVQAYYNSGAKTVGRFDLRLPDGAYYLIFDNRRSVVSAKELSARVYTLEE